MAKIPKNTIVRDNVRKNLRKILPDVCINKFSSSGNNPDWDYKKRLNANLRKRLNSLISQNTIRSNELGEFLGLLEERLMLEGMDLQTGLNEKKALEDTYGKYTKRLNVYTDIYTEDNDCGGFIPYVSDVHVTDKFKEEGGFLIK